MHAEGRPLYAGHAELDWPAGPVQTLWHGASLLREYRGDGHIAVLVGHGLGGLDALVTHTATGQGFREEAAKKRRGWSDDQWTAAVDGLRERGLLDAAGALTDAGVRERERIEDETNAAAAVPWQRVGAEKAGRIRELARELSRAAVAAGAFPPDLFAARR